MAASDTALTKFYIEGAKLGHLSFYVWLLGRGWGNTFLFINGNGPFSHNKLSHLIRKRLISLDKHLYLS